MKRKFVISSTVLAGVLACILFSLSFYIGVTDRLPVDTELWPGPDSPNSQSQILWVFAAVFGVVYFLMTQRSGAFDNVRISLALSVMRSGARLGRIIALVSAAVIVLGCGSCVGNIAVQITDRYLDPSCFYQSPC